MKITHLTLCLKKDDEGKPTKVAHVCAWQNEPSEEDINNLIKELWENEEFGLKGDDDYEMVTIDRSEGNEPLFNQLGIAEDVE